MQLIDIDNDGGTLFGYVCSAGADQPLNYLEEHTEQAAHIADWLRQHCSFVALLKNVNVEPECRGQGFGNRLLHAFLGAIGEAQLALLISDQGEVQDEGFGTLDEWYGRHGFAPILRTGVGMLMGYPAAVAEQLRRAVASAAPARDSTA